MLPEYTVAVSNRHEVFATFEDPEELWNGFRREALKTAEKCVYEALRCRSGMASDETLRNIVKSRATRCVGTLTNTGL